MTKETGPQSMSVAEPVPHRNRMPSAEASLTLLNLGYALAWRLFWPCPESPDAPVLGRLEVLIEPCTMI